MPIVAPSILAADFSKLGDEIRMINASEADWIHCDVMDGQFVPNISFGFPILKAVKAIAQKPLDVHLMIENPGQYIDAFKKVGADHLTVHVEAVSHLDRTVHAIREAGMKVGVALNPATSIDSVQHVLPMLDIVLLMTVNPGFGGQSFIPYVLDKVRMMRQMIALTGSSAVIQVDGGVDQKTAPEVYHAGAESLVAGSYVFRSDNPMATIAGLKAMKSSEKMT